MKYYISITFVLHLFQLLSLKVRDDLIVHRDGHIYMVEDKEESELTCRKVRLVKVRQDYVGLNLPFEMVGIHQYGGLEGDTVTLHEQDVKGKAMMCGQVVAEWMPEWTMSKIDY